MKPFVIISDLHCHEWSAFATPTPLGFNSRLRNILDEILHAGRILKDNGGDLMIVAGDVFHVRGSVSPTVLNAVTDLFKMLIGMDIRIYIIAGNHDIEGKHSTRLGSAVTALEAVGCYTVSEAPRILKLDDMSDQSIALVPWYESIDVLKQEIDKLTKSRVDHLVLHAPIDGVIKGIPDAGLDPKWLAKLGFYSVFAGHYHNHKDFPGNVYSVGAIAHHTWSDVGSQAGFVLVQPRYSEPPVVSFYASHAPRFVELDPSMSEEEMRLEADGNYVKARLQTSNLAELTAIRELLFDAGAKGVTLIPEPAVKTVSRAASSIAKGMTLDESLEQYIYAGSFTDPKTLASFCGDFLAQARSVK